jgi:hypothetical protein
MTNTTPGYYSVGEIAKSFKLGGQFSYSDNVDIVEYFDANVGGTF